MSKHFTLVLTFFTVAFALSAQAPPNLDHFNCYFTNGLLQPVTVQLLDQFVTSTTGATKVTDIRMVRFCNPVQKTLSSGLITPILHPRSHLAMYLINPQPAIPRTVVVQNQFGVQTLSTSSAVILAVPSGKALPIATVPPPLPPIPQDLDHFECYRASGPSLGITVSLKDQFQSEFASILSPILFCNPVQKIRQIVDPNGTVQTVVTPITNPQGHLTCYAKTISQFQTTIFYNNQFVTPATVPPSTVVSNDDILCVPSLKLRWVVIPTPTAFSDAPAAQNPAQP